MLWKIVLPVLAAVFAVGSVTLMVGGLRDIDSNDEGARNALNYAVAEHNRGSNCMYLSQVAEVVKAQSQVVAGVKYVITVKMAKTPCRKDGVNDVCAIHTDPEKAQPYMCTFTVWSKPWLKEISVLNESC
ncbi:cystatin-C-like [Cebidichthys violaceus]|uniref:cystatin-C-like n=1 Tax=Cebidichthys violaceus TaxID=271503 RepID=UPI0035CA1B93